MKFLKEYISSLKEDASENMSSGLKNIKNKYSEEIEKFNVYEFNGKLSIDLIVMKNKNSGYGTKVMQELCDYADSKNLIMILSPSNEFGSSKSRLIEFYKRFGFVENKGKNKIFGIFETMYRTPKIEN